jgi:hypothetical protein
MNTYEDKMVDDIDVSSHTLLPSEARFALARPGWGGTRSSRNESELI